MKKVFVVLGILCSFFGFSQVITVDDTRTADDLVRNVLVNSSCANVANVTSRTGTAFGSSNGIGYFTNTNPAFPFTSGVLLSTGRAVSAPGPNTSDLSEGTVSWTGDAALQTAMAAAGITMNSINATVLEFDFTSFTSFFNFQFLFASEEYGTYQCQSPDAFAFLLTDSVTGITTNLGVVPSTSIPVSVGTVRDQLYNSGCPSANPSYFGLFNGGAAAAGAATNYNGHTVLMNAGANLVPNRTYHIKLVIADNANNNNDVRFDSAVFLGGSSFVFNQDVLGPDVTACNNAGVNIPYTITSGLDPLQFRFVWKDALGNAIPGETGPNLTVNTPGTYQLTYYILATNCEIDTNNIVITYNSSITTPNPVNLYKCNSGLPNYTFDLSLNTPIVDPTSQYQVSYHNTQAEAEGNLNPLPLLYNELTANLPKTIWIRIFNATSGCFGVKSFTLELTTSPVANNPSPITECETTAGSGTASFNLANITPLVLGAQPSSIYNVSYHTTLADANGDVNPIDTSVLFSITTTTIFVRVETITDPNCFTVISLDLVVKPKPVLDNIQDQYVCISYTLPVLTNPGTYYSGPNQGLPVLPVGTVITTNTTVYIYHETGGVPSCSSEDSFQIFVLRIEDITPSDIVACDTATIPAYPYPGTRYFANAGGPVAGNTEYFPGNTITTLGTTTIHVYFTFTDPTCPPISSSFTITVNATPVISTTFSTIFDCNPVNSLPTINTNIGTAGYYTYDAGTSTYTPLTLPITTTTHVYAYAISNNCRSTVYDFMVYIDNLGLSNIHACAPPYDLPALPIGEYRDAPNGGGNIIPPGNINSNMTIYTYVPGSPCTNDDFITITFHQPTVTVPVLAPQCQSYTLPINPEGGRYFTQAGGPNNPANTEYFPGRVITASETIYIYKESTTAPATLTPVCYNEVQWAITINPRPTIDSRGNQVVCYSYTLTSLINGSYYEDPNGVNPITDFTIDATDLRAGAEQVTRVKTIYIYAANPNDSSCSSQNSFTITFDGIEADNPAAVHRCDSYNLPALSPNNFYYDIPNSDTDPTTPHPGNIIAPGTLINTNTTVYIYTYSFNRFACEDENSLDINIYPTPVITPAVQSSIVACNSYTINAPLTVGKYYTLSGGPNVAGNTEIVPPHTFTASQTIYAYAQNGNATITPALVCPVEQQINITVNNVTELPDVPPTCSNYRLNPASLQPGENYYTGTGGVGLLPSNALITSTQTIYIYRNFGTCSDESDFIVNIVPTPVANPATILPVCDTYTANDTTNFDGIYQFDLTQIQATVLGGQTPATDFAISYYTNSTDANAATNPIPNPAAYVNSNPTNMVPYIGSIWVRVANTTSTNACYAIREIQLTVNPLPEPVLLPEYFICKDHETGTLYNSATIDTGLRGANYSFVWTLNNQPFGGNTPFITTNQDGNYEVTVVNLTTTCENKATTKVTLYSPYITVEYSDAFVTPSYITVTVLGPGSGNYEYQIDNEPFQDSNVFYNVSPGAHAIAVRDKDGHCSPAPLEAVIINYPKFFTPNGDGYHETWNIKDLESTNPNAPIFIFDRFGKLLKQITPSTSGWNGNYNGQPMPATDYWFTVEFNEKGTTKTFKAHFTLKR